MALSPTRRAANQAIIDAWGILVKNKMKGKEENFTNRGQAVVDCHREFPEFGLKLQDAALENMADKTRKEIVEELSTDINPGWYERMIQHHTAKGDMALVAKLQENHARYQVG